MPNPFRSLLPRHTMSHTAFERTLLGFQKIRRDSEVNGQSQVGNFQRGGGAVVPAAGHCGKGSRRVNAKAVKDLVRYLERKGQRFDPAEVGNALSALKAVKGGKDIDLTYLAQRMGGLVDGEAFATGFIAVRGQICQKSNGNYEGADGLVDGSAHHASFDEPSTAKAQERAMKDDAIARGKRFSQACLCGPQQKHPDDAKDMFRWLSGELGGSDLTRSIGVNALDDMVEAHEAKLMEQKVALERLLAQAGSRDQEPAFHEEVRQLSKKYMTSQAVHIQTLAFVANVLGVRRHPIDVPPDFRLPMLAFAQSLLNLADALQAPGSDFMQDNRWAAKAKAAAEKRLGELSAPKDPVASQDAHRQPIKRVKADAQKAYADFEEKCLRPQGGEVAINEGQTRLRDAITKKMHTPATATEKLSLGAVKTNLFGLLPDRIQQLYANLSTDVSALQRSGPENALQLKRVRDVARQLDEQIDSYLAQLDAVSRILLSDPEIDDLAEDLDAARLAAGHSIQRLCLLEEDSNGELMRIKAFAHQNGSKAESELARLGMTPASKVRGAPPRPLDSEPAHMEEMFLDEAVDEMVARLLDPQEGSFPAQVPEARSLPTKPIRTSRQVDAQVATLVEAVPAQRNFRMDWDLGRASLERDMPVAQPNPRWSVELENTLSGIDEVVKRFDQAEEVRPPEASVQRPRRMNRQDASANLPRPQPARPAQVPATPPPHDLSFDDRFDDFLFDTAAAVYGKQLLAPAGEIERRDRELKEMKQLGKHLKKV